MSSTISDIVQNAVSAVISLGSIIVIEILRRALTRKDRADDYEKQMRDELREENTTLRQRIFEQDELIKSLRQENRRLGEKHGK